MCLSLKSSDNRILRSEMLVMASMINPLVAGRLLVARWHLSAAAQLGNFLLARILLLFLHGAVASPCSPTPPLDKTLPKGYGTLTSELTHSSQDSPRQ